MSIADPHFIEDNSLPIWRPTRRSGEGIGTGQRIAAVIDGFDRLVHPPQVVYRAKKPPAARDPLPQ